MKLRHGTNQVSESTLIPPAFALGEKSLGRWSLVGQLAQFGIGLGFDSVLLKMSRSHESEADYNGAQAMAEAGYNPIAMAQFF